MLLTLLLLGLVLGAVLLLWRWGWRGLTWVLLMRVPTAVLLGLLLGPIFLTSEGSELLWNLFVMESAYELGLAIGIGACATLVAVGAVRTVLMHGSARFGVDDLVWPWLRKEERSWSVAAFIAVVFAGVLTWNAQLEEGQSLLLALSIGVGVALLLVAAFFVMWLPVTQAIRFVDERRWLARFETPLVGYLDGEGKLLPGHRVMTVVLVTFVLLYAVGAFLPLPTLAYVLLLVSWLCALLSGLAFFFDRFRMPVLAVVAVWIVLMYSISDTDHTFRVEELERPGPVPARAALGRWLQTREQPAPPLVVLCAEGGGIQAASWTAQALIGLEERYGADFRDAIVLASGVSGGSVGLYFYLSGRLSGAAPQDVLDATNASSLTAVGWGLVYPDFLRSLGVPIDPGYDRAAALERAWIRRETGLEEGLDEPRTLADWAAQAAQGTFPAAILNTTVVETGQQLLFKTVRFGVDGATAADPREVPLDFFTEYARHDVRVATAARLSATFPYVTPAARACEPELPGHHLVDGGYYDNFGVASAGTWLWDCFTVLDEKNESGEPRFRLDENALSQVGKIHVVVLRAFPPPVGDPEPASGLDAALLGPLKTLLSTRSSSQVSRNRRELEALGLLTKEKVVVTELRPLKPEEGDVPFSLSWHLTSGEIAQNAQRWRDLVEKTPLVFEALDDSFGDGR